MARYLVAYPIPSPAKERHMEIVKEVAGRFGIKPEYEKIVPHLTLKSPFDEIDPDRIEQLHETLENFARQQKPVSIELTGFGHFRRDVVYVNVLASEEAQLAVAELTARLRSLKWLPFRALDLHKTLHATIARQEITDVFDEMWEAINSYTFDIAVPFDRIALFSWNGYPWRLVRDYSFRMVAKSLKKR